MPLAPRALRVLLAAAVASAAGLLLLGCTSSGDGGVGASEEFENRGADVTTAAVPAAPYVYMRENFSAGDRDTVCVAIDAAGANDVFSAAFTLAYDPALVRPASWSELNGCLGFGGGMVITQVDWMQTPGNVVVGMSRNGSTTMTGVTCGHLIDVCFDILATGSFTMAFTGNTALLHFDGTPVAGTAFVPATIATRR